MIYILQDVMLSGTTTQSPVSSVLTLPSVSMPTGSVSAATMASSLTGLLPESLFLGAMAHEHLGGATEIKNEPSSERNIYIL